MQKQICSDGTFADTAVVDGITLATRAANHTFGQFVHRARRLDVRHIVFA